MQQAGVNAKGAFGDLLEIAIDGMLGALDGSAGFEEFYRSEYRRALALAFSLCGDRGAAEDLVQDAFAVTHRKWDRISTYVSPGAFVRSVVVNRSRSRFRNRRREAAAMARLVPPTPAVEHNIDTDAIWAAVRTLPTQQARCVALRYLDDLDITEIATILGCADSTVRVHLHRARLTLSQRLGLDDHDAS